MASARARLPANSPRRRCLSGMGLLLVEKGHRCLPYSSRAEGEAAPRNTGPQFSRPRGLDFRAGPAIIPRITLFGSLNGVRTMRPGACVRLSLAFVFLTLAAPFTRAAEKPLFDYR